MHADQIRDIVDTRTRRPDAVATAAAARARPDGLVGPSGKLMVIAADHPARGALRAGANSMAMADRTDLLDRIVTALGRPGVNGVLGTPDIIDDLLLLGVLDGKVVLGSMNRGGLANTAWEIDDRFTGYDAAAIKASGFAGGKMLLRIDPDDPQTPSTLQACARAVSDLAGHGLLAMVEPFWSRRDRDGTLRNDLAADAIIRSATVAAGLGTTSAYTWLKLPVAAEAFDDPDAMERLLSATTLPVVLLGGEVSDDADATFTLWEKALQAPTAKGLVVGRSLLYPPDNDVAAAVDRAVSLL